MEVIHVGQASQYVGKFVYFTLNKTAIGIMKKNYQFEFHKIIFFIHNNKEEEESNPVQKTYCTFGTHYI